MNKGFIKAVVFIILIIDFEIISLMPAYASVNCCSLVPALNCDANGRSQIGSGNFTVTYDFINKTVSGGSRGMIDLSNCMPTGRISNFAIQFDDNNGQAQILNTSVLMKNGASNTFDFVANTDCNAGSCNWWTNLFTRSFIDLDVSYDTTSFPNLTFPSLTLNHHYADGTGYIPNGIGIPDSGFPPTGVCGVRTDSWDIILDDSTDQLSSLSVSFGGNCGYSGTVYEMFNVVSFETASMCGDGIQEGQETCESTHAYYTENCPYGETCCHTAGSVGECTLYNGHFCGDGISLGQPEECDDGNGNITGDTCVSGAIPGMCRKCNTSCHFVYGFSGNYDMPLTITGGVVALGKNSNSGIDFNRNIIFYGAESGIPNDNTTPSEYVEYDPRYIDIYRKLFGEIGDVTFNESGVK